jgi:hypothetical protein
VTTFSTYDVDKQLSIVDRWIPQGFKQLPWPHQLLFYVIVVAATVHLALTARNKKSRGLLTVSTYLVSFVKGQNIYNPNDFLPPAGAQPARRAPQGYLHQQQVQFELPPLPARVGDRPDTERGLCHWQVTQQPSLEFATAVRYEIFGPHSALQLTPGISTGPSRWEQPPTDAFYYHSGPEKAPLEFAFLQGLQLRGHRDLASWHVVLAPDDARAVVELGWAEFHPLSGFGSSEPGFVMIYAPRNVEEVAVLQRILFAALEYAKDRDAAAPVLPGRVQMPPSEPAPPSTPRAS